jgi:type I restriction enzyme, S subunit
MIELITLKIKDFSLSIKTGSTPVTSQIMNYEGGNYNWFTPGDFTKSNNILKTSKRKITQYAVNNSATIFAPKTVLITCIGDIGNSGILEDEASSNQQITGIFVNEKIISPYLFNYLIAYNKSKLQGKSNKAIVSILNNKNLKEIEFKFPKDLQTQNKIVAILDKASALVSKRENTIQILDELLRASFLELFQEDLVNFKKSNTKLCNIASIVSGLTKGRKTKETDLNEVPYLRVANAQDGYFNLKEIKNITATKREVEQYNIIKGDLLITEGGDPDKLGRGAVWENEDNKFIYQNHLFRLRINNLNDYSPYWLIQLLSSEFGKYYFLRQAKQTTGIATINKRQVSNFPIPSSSYRKQKEFEKNYLRIKASSKILLNSLAELKTLLNSIAQKVFNGQLNFNVDFELDALIQEIDLQKKENDLSKIVEDIAYLQRLIDKLNSQEFKEKDIYDKAKHGAFQLMAVKEEERKITQEYDGNSKSIKLALK